MIHRHPDRAVAAHARPVLLRGLPEPALLVLDERLDLPAERVAQADLGPARVERRLPLVLLLRLALVARAMRPVVRFVDLARVARLLHPRGESSAGRSGSRYRTE